MEVGICWEIRRWRRFRGCEICVRFRGPNSAALSDRPGIVMGGSQQVKTGDVRDALTEGLLGGNLGVSAGQGGRGGVHGKLELEGSTRGLGWGRCFESGENKIKTKNRVDSKGTASNPIVARFSTLQQSCAMPRGKRAEAGWTRRVLSLSAWRAAHGPKNSQSGTCCSLVLAKTTPGA